MSQPRRRRRNRRRRSGGSGGSNEPSKREAVERSRSEADDDSNPRRTRSRRSGRGRRGRTRARDSAPKSPQSSEDLVRGDPKRRPGRLTGAHDGTTLEQVIGELQSSWGVPQHPQEYRITLKVAEERGDRAQVTEERADPEDVEASTGAEERPRREKAPAAPRIGAGSAEAESPNGAKPPKKRRSRRRRRRSKGGGGN